MWAGAARTFSHGHDGDARDELEIALHRLDLEPFILMNSSGEGRTIIEALEGYIGRDFSSDFGIVLMTADDLGYYKRSVGMGDRHRRVVSRVPGWALPGCS